MRLLTPVILTLFIVLFLLRIESYSQDEGKVLVRGKSVEAKLKGGENHKYRIALSAGQYLYAVTEQRGIDVVLTLFGPDGKSLLELNRTSSQLEEEPLWFVSQADGIYILEVRSPNRESPEGLYQIKIEELRAALPDDITVAAAGKAMNKADILAAAESEDASATAVEKCRAGAEIFKRLGDQKNQARALETIGRIYQLQEKAELAIDYNRQALKIYESLGLQNDITAMFVRLGVIFDNSWEYRQAMEYYEKAIVLAEQTRNKRSIAVVRNNLALIQAALGEFELARENYEKSMKLAAEINMKDLVANALNNLGNLYSTKGNYALALEFQQRNLAVSVNVGDENFVARALMEIGSIHSSQGSDNLALEYAEKALSIYRKTKNARSTAYVLNNIGTSYSALGDSAKALDFFDQSIQIINEKGIIDTVSVGNMGLEYLRQENYGKALSYFQNALDISKGEDAWVVHQMARAYFDQKGFVRSLEYDNRAIELARTQGLVDVLSDALALRGHTNFSLGRTSQALQDLQESISINEALRFQLAGGPAEQTSFFKDRLSPYYSMVELLISKNKRTEALDYAERAKSRALLDLLRNGKVDVTKSMSAREQERERDLKIEYAAINIRNSESEDKTLVSGLTAQLEKKRLELEDFRIGLYALHPELRVQRGEMKPVGLEEAGRLLTDTKSALLEFVVTDDKGFLFVITQDSGKAPTLKSYSITGRRDEMAAKIEKYRSALAAGNLGFAAQGRELYDLFLKPAEQQLAGKTSLTIVPDGPLWDLPFQALVNGQGKYLIEQAAVSYAPSLTALQEMKKRAKGTNTRLELLAFGNPTVAKGTVERVGNVFMGEKLEPLPEAERLVRNLGKMYGANRSKVYTGEDAREETAKTEAPKYRIVQFATHGILNNVSPMYSHLVMAQNDKNPNEDGLLEAWEMKDLDLHADIVILSACDTARGKISNGEGMIGMTWAMFIAGTPTTVASQWKVESSSTTELMLEFHRQLLSGKNISKAEALRQASLKVMKMPRYRHPSYWAGFVLVGDGN